MPDRAGRGFARGVLEDLRLYFDVDLKTPWKDLPPKQRKLVLYGATRPRDFVGVIPSLAKRFEKTTSESVKRWLLEFMSELPCTECGGRRLKPESLAVKTSVSGR